MPRTFSLGYDGSISMQAPNSSVASTIYNIEDTTQKILETIQMAYRAGRRDVVNELKDQLDVINR